MLDKKVGIIISYGLLDKNFALKLITEVGNKHNPVQDKIKSVETPFKLFCLSKLLQAEIPSGVAIPLIPSKFADMFKDISVFVSLSTLPKSFLIGKNNIFASYCPNPLASTKLKNPSQSA